jgi:tetratricopeptide (TPR) repeat protein
MAYWGEALSLGPHINAGMSQAAVSLAWDAIQKAKSLSSAATEEERAYIDALAQRYSGDPSANRNALDQAYADAMRELANRYPDDPDAQALFAEALMVTTPWDYWLADGSPKPVTEEISTTLTESMDRQPYHPATNHFYIHLVESHHPERGEPAADRLRDLVPQAGHLQHMPSHIYIHIGRWADASLANEKAVKVDREYLDNYGAHGMYRISYMPHNSIYLCFTTSMEGRGAACLEAAETTRDLILEKQLYQPGYGSLTQGYSLRYIAMARFGKWNDMLNEAAPPAELLFPTAIWHYARGLAFLRTEQPDSAKTELGSLEALTTEDNISRMDFRGVNATRSVLRIAASILAGEIAASAGDYDKGIDHLRAAVELEDNLGYYEPPVWFSPSRQILGALLLEAGRPVDAEEVYRRDLEEYPNNGWSLFGLYSALMSQGKNSEAEDIKSQFDEAWSRADVSLTSSRM